VAQQQQPDAEKTGQQKYNYIHKTVIIKKQCNFTTSHFKSDEQVLALLFYTYFQNPGHSLPLS